MAVLDENTENPLAQDIRVNLWAEHLCIPVEQHRYLKDIDYALRYWFDGRMIAESQRVEKVDLSRGLPRDKEDFNQFLYDHFTDYDSRSTLW